MIAWFHRVDIGARAVGACWLIAAMLTTVMFQIARADGPNPNSCCASSNACSGCLPISYTTTQVNGAPISGNVNTGDNPVNQCQALPGTPSSSCLGIVPGIFNDGINPPTYNGSCYQANNVVYYSDNCQTQAGMANVWVGVVYCNFQTSDPCPANPNPNPIPIGVTGQN